jgi:acyl carrier protein
MVRNPSTLAVYTFSLTLYLSSPPGIGDCVDSSWGGQNGFPTSRRPCGQSFGNLWKIRESPGSVRKEQGVSLEDDVKKIVSEKLSVAIDEVKIDSNFIDDLKADSLDIVELGMAFEDKFGVSIPDEDYEKLRTVKNAVDYIEERK